MQKSKMWTLCILASTVWIPVCAIREARADWSTYQGNVAHTGYVPGKVNASATSLLWADPISKSALGGLTIGGNGVYLQTAGYTITAINEQTGTSMWANSYPYGVGTGQADTISAPAYAYGKVYFQTDNEVWMSQFHAVNAATGAQVFFHPIQRAVGDLS